MRILRVERVLIDVGGGVEGEQASAAGQIERKQAGRERRAGVGIVAGVRLKSRRRALARIGQRGIADRSSRRRRCRAS